MPNDATTIAPAPLEIGIVSDTICPWCLVGKRRLERAMTLLAPEGIRVVAHWLPFELNPTMPVEGVERRAYRTWKFGSWEKSEKLDANLTFEGATEGIDFRFDLMPRTPNTRASHRLLWLADAFGAGMQDQVVEALFAAYFTQGQDIGDAQVLRKIGVACGLPEARVAAAVAGDEGRAEVDEALEWARDSGINGVPSVIAADMLLFSGALPPEDMAQALRHVAAQARA